MRERSCIVARQAGDPARLIRFVLSPEGVVTPDFSERLPGRGAWVSCERAFVLRAAGEGMFSRAFRRAARLPDGVDADAFAAQIESGLRKRALAALGLARKAGAVAPGFDLTVAMIRAGKAGLVLSAADAGHDGVSKLESLKGALIYRRVFSTDEQSAAIGRDGLVHAAIAAGEHADRLIRETARLEQFCALD